MVPVDVEHHVYFIWLRLYRFWCFEGEIFQGSILLAPLGFRVVHSDQFPYLEVQRLSKHGLHVSAQMSWQFKCLFAIIFPALFDMREELKVEVHCNLIKVARLLPTLAGHLEGQKGNWDTGGDVQGLYTPASIVWGAGHRAGAGWGEEAENGNLASCMFLLFLKWQGRGCSH